MVAEGGTDSNVDAGELSKFARLAARWWDADGPLATLHAINPIRTAYIADRVELRGIRLLDVGCGAGLLTEALASRGARVTGIDLAADSIKVAERHAADSSFDIDYRVAAAEDIGSGEDGTYDVVTCLELLEHVPRPEVTVAACARLVRPGGKVFFSTINRNAKSFALAIVFAEHVLRLLPRGTHEYLKLIKPSELAGFARAAGLDLEDLTGLHFNPLTQTFKLGGNVDVNYLACARRPESD